MAQITLKRLLGKRKEATRLINKLINAAGGQLSVQDAGGNHLAGPPAVSGPKQPITLAGQVLGWVRGEAMAAELAELISYLAAREADKRNLAGEALDRYREINLLYNLSEQLSAKLELKPVAQLTLNEARRLIPGDIGAIMLADLQQGTFEPILTFGQPDRLAAYLSASEGIIGAVVQSGKAEIVNDVAQDKRYTRDIPCMSSLVCAPLRVKQTVIGIIFIGSETPLSYTAADLKLLNTLASQAAPAIDNALLYEKQLQEAEALEKKNMALEQLDKLKDEFLANTSHELRTPLNGIIGIAESMIDGATGPLSKDQQHNLLMMAVSARRLSNLVNDILDFSRLKHHDLELQIRAMDMCQITDLVMTLLQPLAAEKNLALHNEIGEDIPLVAGDENRFEQIMYNLIGNAIKFTPAGSVTVSAVKQTDGMVAVTVADTGIGIPIEKFEDIFKSFEQIENTDVRLYGGTGLGLSITRQIVELHGGKIWVDSAPGEGSRFTFTVPISPRRLQRAVDPGQQLARVFEFEHIGEVTTPEPPPSNGRFSILIVDDEPVNRQVLVNHLSLNNYALMQAGNGFEALKLIRNGHKPDLVLLDIMMPRMSGYKVCQEIRRLYPPTELPVVMLTAKNQVANLVQGFEVGANDYLTKPFSKNELLARVSTHLRLAKINLASQRFVPGEFLEFLQKESIVEVNLGDHVSKEMAIMFSDIRSFTSLSETMTPQENFDFVNTYLRQVSPIIRDHRGFIIKYLGDGMMALFPNGADDAVEAGLNKLRAVDAFNRLLADAGMPAIEIGIGVHTGHMMVGMVGEAARMQGDAFSDNVNLSARLEGLTKYYRSSFIISEDTFRHLSNPARYHIRLLDRVQVKGRRESVTIYEIFDGDPPELLAAKLASLAQYEQAQALFYKQEISQAEPLFAQILAQNPLDHVAHLFLERCNLLLEQGVPHNWTGIEVMNQK